MVVVTVVPSEHGHFVWPTRPRRKGSAFWGVCAWWDRKGMGTPKSIADFFYGVG